MAELLENLGHNIRRLREQKRWNQTELGFHAKTSSSIISLIENGKRNPSTATLARIADALDVEVVDLFPKVQNPLPLEEEAAFPPAVEEVIFHQGYGPDDFDKVRASAFTAIKESQEQYVRPDVRLVLTINDNSIEVRAETAPPVTVRTIPRLSRRKARART